QPAGWVDGIDTPGNAGGTAVNPGDEINGVTLAVAQDGINYDFGEYKLGSIRGTVRVEPPGKDCETDPNLPPIAGVTIELLDTQGKVLATTTTNSAGEYVF